MKLVFKNDHDFDNLEKNWGGNFAGTNVYCYNQDGDICVVFGDKGDEWQMVGGGREEGETPIQTLTREVMEEAQGELKDVEFLHLTYADMFEDDGVTPLTYEQKLKYVEGPRNLLPNIRYIGELINYENFVPCKYNDEITERKFIPVSEMPQHFAWMHSSENGRETFELLKRKLTERGIAFR